MDIKVITSLLRSKLIGDSVISFGSKIFGAALTYVMLVVFARLMSAPDYGQFGVALNASVVLSTLIGFGLPVAAMRIYPVHRAAGEPARAKGFLLLAYKLVAIGGIAAALVSLAYAATREWSAMPLAIAILALLTALTDLVAGVLRAQGATAWSAIPRDIGWRTAAPLLAGLGAMAGWAISNTVALAICIVTLAVIAALQISKSLALMNKEFGDARPQSSWKALIIGTLPLWAASIVFALNQQADVVVVGGLLGSAAAAPYFAAQKTAALLSLAMVAGGQVAAPLMAAAYHSGNKIELRRICKLLALAIAGTTVLGFLFLMVVGGLLLRLFDPAFMSAYPILLIFAASVTVDALSGPTAYLMQMTSLEKTYLVIMAVVYAAVLTLQLLFVPAFGPVAAALCAAAGVIAWNITAIIILRRKLGVDPSVFGLLWPVKS